MLFSDDEFEEPIGVFYQRLSKLADHMLAAPDLNMYLCVIQYPFVKGTRLKEAPDLIPKWCGYFPPRNKKCSCDLVDTETPEYSCSTKPPNTQMPSTEP